MAMSRTVPLVALLVAIVATLAMSCATSADAKRVQLARKLQQDASHTTAAHTSDATGCSWLTTDNLPLNATGTASASCSACRLACAVDSLCASFSYNGAAVTSAFNTTACGAAPSSPCRFFLSDESPDSDPLQKQSLTCRDCQRSCAGADNCIYWSFNNSDVAFYTNTSTCGIPVSGGMCQWFKADGVTPDLDDVQVNVTDCTSCQQQCDSSRASECTFWSYNGSAVRYSSDECPIATNCRWFLEDGVTVDEVDVQSNITDCHSCATECTYAPNCKFWNWNETETLHVSVQDGCSANRTRPCLWFVNATTPDTQDLQGNVSTCRQCREECRDAPHCYRFSFNGSSVVSYANNSVCPVEQTGPCRWFKADGSPNQDEEQNNIRTCAECQAGCFYADGCATWSFNTTTTHSYDVFEACGLNVSNGMCQWFKADGVTPDDETQAGVTDCSSCQQQCRIAAGCHYWSYNGAPAAHYRERCTNDHGTNCRWFQEDGVTPDDEDEQVNVTDCRSCAAQCAAAPNCEFWSWNETETLHSSVQDGCSANRTRPCQWFIDPNTTDTQDLQGNVSTCRQCRVQCRDADACFYFSFNGSDISSYADDTACPVDPTGPCRWFTADGSPDRNDLQNDLFTCTSCQEQCLRAPECVSWSFNHSAIQPQNATGTCGLNVTNGMCQWFRSSGVTPDYDTQVNVTDCASCRQQCKDAPNCYYYSYNGSETRHYRTACSASQTGPCRWFLQDGYNPDDQDEQTNVHDCQTCGAQCAAAPNCIYWNWNHTQTLHYTTRDACSAYNTRMCRWYRSDGDPDTEDLQGDVSSCLACQMGCAMASRCTFFSFNHTDLSRFNSTSACPDWESELRR